MQDEPYFNFNRDVGRAVDDAVGNAQYRLRQNARAVGTALVGRALTRGELNEINWMFGTIGNMARAVVYNRNFWWPYPNRRPMAPDGNIHMPNSEYREDYSSPQVERELRAVFMHEATHVYQRRILGWQVWARGMVDRTYDYELVPGRPLRDYGLEQMGAIVEDFYLLRHGGRISRPYRLEDYRGLLPLRG